MSPGGAKAGGRPLAEPAFSDQERLALAGPGRVLRDDHEAYAFDLRQFTAWCHGCRLRLFAVRRADIECFARDLEAAGQARATITRRLSTKFAPVDADQFAVRSRLLMDGLSVDVLRGSLRLTRESAIAFALVAMGRDLRPEAPAVTALTRPVPGSENA